MEEIIYLSSKQQEIVNFKTGSLLVKASAGSGKTRVLTERIKLLLTQTKRKILAITFTNKADEEMRERLSDVQDLKERTFIGTFHGFCKDTLENHGFSIGLSSMPHIFEEETDRLKLIEQAIEVTPSYYVEFIKKSAKEQMEFTYRVLEFISLVKRALYSNETLLEETNDENLVLLYSNYQDILHGQNAIDYDDLIYLTYKLFMENQHIAGLYRRGYEYICIDEAQDLNNAQYQLIQALTNGEQNNVMMVGDPNQSIYAFNGSSSDYMTVNFVNDFKPTVIELNENYRSSRSILQLAEKIIPDSSDVIAKTVKNGITEIVAQENDAVEANCICEQINELIKIRQFEDIEGDISYDRIAVLARNKYVFKELQEAFSKNNIPFYFKIKPGSIQYESEIMRIFDLAIRVKLNPHDRLHWQRLCELLKINNIECIDLKKLSENTQIQPGFKNCLSLVSDLSDDGSNFKQLLNQFKGNISNNPSMESIEQERVNIFNDIDELLLHWHNYVVKTENKSLNSFRNSMALGQTHPLSQVSGVTLSTVHTMKGLQYDIVFIMGLDDGTFPDYRARSKLELTQEKNNLYVAITRSKRFLFLTWPQKRIMPWGDSKNREISRFFEGDE